MTDQLDPAPQPDPVTEPAPATKPAPSPADEAAVSAAEPAAAAEPVTASAAEAADAAAEPVTAIATRPAPSPATAAAAAAAPAAATVAAQDPSAARPVPRRRNRVLGLSAQIAGVLGIVVCLALVVGVLVGRGWATDTVSQLATDVDAKLAQAAPLMDTASAKVSEVSGRIGALADAATAVAALPGPGADVLTGLRGALNRVSERYLELRTTYGNVRQAAVGALDGLKTLDQLLPGFELPQGPVDALAKLDAGIQDLDAKVTGLADAIPETGPISAIATAVATKATEAQGKLQGLNGVIDDARTKLAEVRTKLASTADTVNTIITVGSIVAVLLLLWIALLHGVLFGTGRRLRREASGA